MTAPQKGCFQPLHDAHAIEQVGIGVTFIDPLDDKAFREVIKAVKQEFGNELPGQAPVQTLQFALGAPSRPIPAINGYVFSRSRADGVVESELRMDANSFGFRTAVYTCWHEVWGEASRYFNLLIRLYCERRISEIALNFVDKFNWIGAPEECRAKHVLRQGSPYVCPHIFDAPEQWHSYTGVFEKGSDRVKRLLNLNVDLLEHYPIDGRQLFVQLTTLLTDRLNQPGYAPSLEMSVQETVDFTLQDISAMHDRSKQVFISVINDAMCKRVGIM